MSKLATAFSTFDRTAMPNNLLLVSEWRQFARNAEDWVRQNRDRSRGCDWLDAAYAWARTNGGALVMQADDSLIVLTRRDDKVSRRTHKPGTWGWAK